jgi:type VI secretion system protein VasD
MSRRRFTIAAALAAAGTVLAGCAGKPPVLPQMPAVPAPPPAPAPKPLVVPPRTLQIDVRADTALNLDARDRPAPLVVRIYELRGPVAFQAADFFGLYEREQAALGNDLVGREEIQVRPGESRKLGRDLHPESRVVAVLAAYRDLERASWRALLTLPDPPPPTAKPPAAPIVVPVRILLGPRAVQIFGP